MVKQAAHDSWDECSNHFGLKVIFLKLNGKASAGIGRQDNLKIYWYFNIVNVQVVFRIILSIILDIV